MSRKKVVKTEPVVLEDPLYTKYRPKSLDDVMGHDDVIRSIRKAIAAPTRPHSFLFTGPAGTGKTTLARILATGFGCDASSIKEVDAASVSGVDAMRELLSTIHYQSLSGTPNKAYLIDEAHRLSAQSWDVMLKSLEEPPPHVYFFLVTSEAGKVPATIASRCNSYTLKSVKYADILEVLEHVCDAEGYTTPDAILKQVAMASGGSPRRALVMLSMVYTVTDPDESARLLESPTENIQVIDICRDMVRGSLRWQDVTAGLKALNEPNAESVRIVIVNYLNACLMGAKTDASAQRLLDMLHAFTRPCNPADKLAPILLAFGEFVFK